MDRTKDQLDATAGEPPVLDTLYASPGDALKRSIKDHLVDFHIEYLRIATFFCLATGKESGLDNSPRGGPPGFVHVLDRHTIAFGDWPGNNRIESMRNIEFDDRLALLFIYPGLQIFMRINGRGRVSADPDLLARLTDDVRKPKTAIVVAIDEVLFHCGKAINRARLWSEESRIDPKTLPSTGQMLIQLGELEQVTAEEINADIEDRYRNDLY
jgi:PPOX class probable FMN-dependent enzyme